MEKICAWRFVQGTSRAQANLKMVTGSDADVWTLEEGATASKHDREVDDAEAFHSLP